MIAAIVGHARFENLWNGYASAQLALQGISDPANGEQVDEALKRWGNELLDKKRGYYPGEDGDVSTLILIYRVKGSTYYAFEEIDSHDHKLSIGAESTRVLLGSDDAAMTTAGKCRDFFNGQEITYPLSDSDKGQLQSLANQERALGITSSSQLGELAIKMESLLADINKRYKHADDIGPPYQLVTLEAGSDRWLTQFKSPCGDTDTPTSSPQAQSTTRAQK